MKKNIRNIAKSFDNIKLDLSHAKPKVGIVGEIYVKYAPLGNNHLEEFLVSQGAEVMVPGLYGFILYCLYNSIYDYKFYKGSKLKMDVSKLIISYLRRREKVMIESIAKTKFTPMQYFSHTKDLSDGVLSHGTKMGEGWLLTAEMMELIETNYENIVCTQPFGCLPNHICGKGVMKKIIIETNYENIVCTQPFGCLPNHICGKGVMKKIKSIHPNSNIVAIDYDPSATRVNQENRIKLMLSIARERIKEDEKANL